ncbi:hypothetical protein EAH72_35280 [Pseudomonas caspiana]|nr:hypothetical protein EAH72_35280 [Pseudomonas caspiana]
MIAVDLLAHGLDLLVERLDTLYQLRRQSAQLFRGKCSGLMKPDTHLGENARQIEVSYDQTTPFLFC